MCLSCNLFYPECGHSGQKEYRVCDAPESCAGLRHYGKEEGMIIPGRFCPECFMLPDPRAAYVGEGECKVYGACTIGEHAECHGFWEQSESLTSDDFLAMIGPRLAFPRIMAVVHLETMLHADFWWRIKRNARNPDFAAPTLAQRLLVRQLGKVIAHYRVERMNDVAKERRPYIPVDFSTLKREDGEHDCTLCYDAFKVPESIGEGEADKHKPIITACKHIFGEECLITWFRSSSRRSCPNCRRNLVPEQAEWYPRLPTVTREDAENVAMEREMPEWLLKLNGHDPALPCNQHRTREQEFDYQEELGAFMESMGFVKNGPEPVLRWVRPEFRRD